MNQDKIAKAMTETELSVNLPSEVVDKTHRQDKEYLFIARPFNRDPIVCKELLRLKDVFNVDTIIETGTFMGVTTKWFNNNFTHVHSIEINDKYYEISNILFKHSNCDNITLHKGSSTDILPKILENLNDSDYIMFYLDAHWGKLPLLSEIDAIAKHCHNRAIIVIDDFQVPDKSFLHDKYAGKVLCYEYIKESLDKCYDSGNYIHYYLNDSERPVKGVGKIYVMPKKINNDSNAGNDVDISDLYVLAKNGQFYSTLNNNDPVLEPTQVTKAKTIPKPTPKSVAKPVIKPVAKPVAKPNTIPKSNINPKSKPKTISKPKPTLTPKSKPKSKPK